jgi:hypothetical protein
VSAPSQAVSSEGNFHTVLAHASTEHGSEQQSTSDTATSSPRARAKNSSAGGLESKATSLAEPEAGKVADPDTVQAQTTSDTTGAGLSADAEAAPASAPVSAAVQSSSDVYFRQPMSTVAGVESSSIRAVDMPAGNIATSGLSTKQDRSKVQTEVRKAAAGIAVSVVEDPGRLPAVNLISFPGTVHGQERGSSENFVKNAASENFAGIHGKTPAPPDRLEGRDAGVTSLPSGAIGDQQGVQVQAPTQPFEVGLDLSVASGLSANSEPTSHADMGMPAGNSMGTSFAATAPVSSKAIDGASNTKSVTAGLADAAWHDSNGSQAGLGLQADASKTGAGMVISRSVENDAAQTTLQTMVTPAGSHQSATAQPLTSGAPDSAHAGRAQDLPASAHLAAGEGTPASGINSAKLIQTMGETEMHVGMHSVEFGDISIRTSLSQQQMVTHISLDHTDLSQAISSHLSAVQAKLGEEYGLRASIEVNSQGALFSGGQGNSQQGDQQSPGRSSGGAGMGPAELSESVSSVVALPRVESGHGLDITV